MKGPLLVLVMAGVVASAYLLGRGARAGETTAVPDASLLPPSPSSAASVVPGLPVRFALGINEAVAVPQKLLREGHFTAESLAAHLDQDGQRATALGARFARGNSGAFPRSSWWSHTHDPGAADETDLWVRVVQAHGLEPILMVSPWPGNRTANVTTIYVPPDLAAYTAWVRTLVERYDGDGVDDLPGLRAPVRYWEVDNEPDLKFTNAPRDATRDVPPGSFCHPDEAAAVLLATSAAIRAADPDAKVLNGGLYRPFADSGQAYLRELLAVPGVLDAFDILSLHSYASDEHGDAYARGLRAARKLAQGKPIFVTETSVASEGEERWMSPQWQARMVATVAARGAVEGARVVVWHTLADPPPIGRRSGFERHSLLVGARDGSVTDKPAAAVYRNLAARLAEDDLTGATQDGDGAVRLRSNATLLYEGTRDARAGGIDLRDGRIIEENAVATAPAWLWP
ncbi:MAG: glycoside hydrolase family 44 protein [Pseudomonadota bacterium]|nr:glycoside hydrolase family 44 protein [Pseudomonadota bacterium]